MSDAARPSRLRFGFPGRRSGGFFSGAGRAGPRRLALIGGAAIALAAFILVVATSGRRVLPVSADARMQTVDPLPGGLNSTPEQTALAHQAETHGAALAAAAGTSYTPPMAPSVPLTGAPPHPVGAAPLSASPPRPRFATRPPPAAPRMTAAVFPPQVVPGRAPAAPSPAMRPIPIRDPEPASWSPQVNDLFNAWRGRLPETEVILPPGTPAPGAGTAVAGGNGRAAAAKADPQPLPTPVSATAGERVLIPAGRGVYAHPILALSSDQTSPVVLQADSGPIAGDRMIGNFDRQGDRLVIHIGSIIHNGRSIASDGVVIAPDTMEAAVASGVDEHYLARFILPAAAAFVQGLGAALATTSNTTAVLSPFGGASTITKLNLPQQLGVAAGVAAGQVGSALVAAAPKGPTVTLAANVGVGVMFLSAVKVPGP